MGFCGYTIPLPNRSPLKLLKDLILASTVSSSEEFKPSPSLVPLPDHIISKSHKNHLPIVEYTMLNPRTPEEKEAADSCCAVCLDGIEPLVKVRKLGHCTHAFHVECLDSWMELGHDTCPVCRAKVLPAEGLGLEEDKWRSERMVYLFGEDCVFEEL